MKAYGASHPGRFTPRKRAPGTHWIERWVGPRAGLEAEMKRETPSPNTKTNASCSGFYSKNLRVFEYFHGNS